jgi:osmotically-inducible protein OsmY
MMKALVRRGVATDLAMQLSLREVDASYAAGLVLLEKPQSLRQAEIASEEIVRRVRDELEAQLPGRIRQLRVTATEKFVILSGSCSSYHTKQLAQHAAMELLNSERLINDIAVVVPK